VAEVSWGPGGELGAVTEAGDILVLDPRAGLDKGLRVGVTSGGAGAGTGSRGVTSAPHVEQTGCDWRMDRPGILATAGVDAAARIWDVRWPAVPVSRLAGGHTLSLLRVRWDPAGSGKLLTCGYDRAVCLWACGEGGVGRVDGDGDGDGSGMRRWLAAGGDSQKIGEAGAGFGIGKSLPSIGWRLEGRMQHHREFVRGVAWSDRRAGVVASCGWDGVSVAWQAVRERAVGMVGSGERRGHEDGRREGSSAGSVTSAAAGGQ